MMSKTVENFCKGLQILSKTFPKGTQETYFLGAEHDIIYIYLGDEEYEFTDKEIQRLDEYGFHENDAGGWSYVT
jgi:hypothetical protein